MIKRFNFRVLGYIRTINDKELDNFLPTSYDDAI